MCGSTWPTRPDRANRADNDLNREIQVACHLADNGRLLSILLPEIGSGRLDASEQFGHNRCDPAEVTGTLRPFEKSRKRSTSTQVW